MRRENGRVLIDISDDEYAQLLMLFGYAMGWKTNIYEHIPREWLILLNSMNEGNPRWTPYEVPEQVIT